MCHQACRAGYRAGYHRAWRLFHELTLARADGTYVRPLGKLARILSSGSFWLAEPVNNSETAWS
jgi:hypothetical protein